MYQALVELGHWLGGRPSPKEAQTVWDIARWYADGMWRRIRAQPTGKGPRGTLGTIPGSIVEVLNGRRNASL
jgi:hypothetical protein